MATQQIPQLEVQSRSSRGSREAARLRKAGRLPAVIYGHKKDPVTISVDRKQVTDLLHKNARLLEVKLDAATEPCLIKEVQWNHLGSQIVHVDLTRVDLSERVTVEIPLQFVGEAPGLKETGAIMEKPVSELEIECLVTAIPEVIKVDVSAMNVGDVLAVKDIKLPEGVKAITDADTVIASIHIMAEEVVEVAAPAEGAAEPEVIGKKEEEGAEGEAAAPAAGGKAAAAPKKEAEKK